VCDVEESILFRPGGQPSAHPAKDGCGCLADPVGPIPRSSQAGETKPAVCHSRIEGDRRSDPPYCPPAHSVPASAPPRMPTLKGSLLGQSFCALRQNHIRASSFRQRHIKGCMSLTISFPADASYIGCGDSGNSPPYPHNSRPTLLPGHRTTNLDARPAQLAAPRHPRGSDRTQPARTPSVQAWAAPRAQLPCAHV
jgi:hypothetical protein